MGLSPAVSGVISGKLILAAGSIWREGLLSVSIFTDNDDEKGIIE